MSQPVVNQINISGLEHRIGDLARQTEQLNQRLSSIDPKINKISENLIQLQNDFNAMLIEQRKTAALQEAATELVRVRQEIDQQFGNYRVVRETMLGVLQATDLALVKKTTISRVSEEIMLSTPEYWLAPCLVAVAAWIGNDKDLASRAIAEAARRDKEKTALTMALICRRNNRIATCYEWLSIYFDQQDSAEFSEGSFAYIDAYVNGVFGPDKKHMCEDYIAKWMNEIRGSSSRIEMDQEEVWKEYCSKFTINIDQMFPDLRECVPEYERINAYVARLNSVDAIKENFSGINNAYIDTNKLKTNIDKNLIQLISRYDGREEPLRREESVLLAIRALDGNKEAAKAAILRREQARQQKALNLVEQMTKVIITEDDVAPSKRKTAVRCLSGYIRKGFNSFIEEKKSSFPADISLAIDGWIGTTSDGNNKDKLSVDFEQKMNENLEAELNAINRKTPKMCMIGAIIAGVLGLGGLFFSPPIGIVFLIGAGALGLSINRAKKSIINVY